MATPPLADLLLALLFSGACGGGGGGVGADPGAPDVALFVVSGHNFGAASAASYLSLDAGPAISDDLIAAGYSVSTAYFVDDTSPAGGAGGYFDLVAGLQRVRDEWAAQGTRVVVVAHSHGGVWAHAAIRAVPGVQVEALVDLDVNCYGWDLVGHTPDDASIGGDPRDAFDLGLLASVPAYPGVPSEPTGFYDVEDIVFPNVVSDLEVRSGDSAPFAAEWYDEKWNLRLDGTSTGITYLYSATDHAEVHDPSGTTLAVVEQWLRDRLAD